MTFHAYKAAITRVQKLGHISSILIKIWAVCKVLGGGNQSKLVLVKATKEETGVHVCERHQRGNWSMWKTPKRKLVYMYMWKPLKRKLVYVKATQEETGKNGTPAKRKQIYVKATQCIFDFTLWHTKDTCTSNNASLKDNVEISRLAANRQPLLCTQELSWKNPLSVSQTLNCNDKIITTLIRILNQKANWVHRHDRIPQRNSLNS